TLLAMAQSLPSFERRSSLSTWLYTIARSFCIKKRRKSKFAPTELRSLELATHPEDTLADDALAAQGGAAPDAALARRELGAALERAIQALDIEHREVLVLRDVEGLSAAEVAEVLGVSVSAAKSRLHRARLKVRQSLAPLLAPREALPAAGSQCPDILSMYSQHLEGDIDQELCRRLENHVASCERCKSQCDSLKQTLALCGSASEARVPEQLRESVRRALRDFLAARPATSSGSASEP